MEENEGNRENERNWVSEMEEKRRSGGKKRKEKRKKRIFFLHPPLWSFLIATIGLKLAYLRMYL